MTAAVAVTAGAELELLEVELDDPREDEILVRILATGICHTDLAALSGRLPVTMPIILGHEGAGEVVEVGARVTAVRPGDRVVILPDHCAQCDECRQGRTAYCRNAGRLVFGGVRLDGSPKASRDGSPIRAGFFGQSSFAQYSLVTERNVIRVAPDAPLDTYAALTCGVTAGAGAVLNTLKPEPQHSIAVFGAGAVGLAAVAAAAVRGARTIIAVDVHSARLDLALSFGATHVIDASGGADVDEELARIVPAGLDRALDSTGVKDVILTGIHALGPHGVLGYVAGTGGVPLDLDLGRILSKGVTIRGIMGGDGTSGLFHREVIDLVERGLLPIDKIITPYRLDEIGTAIRDMRSGTTIKPVLVAD